MLLAEPAGDMEPDVPLPVVWPFIVSTLTGCSWLDLAFGVFGDTGLGSKGRRTGAQNQSRREC